MKRILIFINSFEAGGAEKILKNLSIYLSNKAYKVTILTINNKGPLKINLPSNIKKISMNKKKLIHSFFKYYFLIKLNKPDIVLTSLPHLSIFVIFMKLLFKFNYKILIREANVYDLKYSKKKFTDKLFIFLKKFFYRYADNVLVITNAVKNNLLDVQKVKVKKISLIYNPVIDATILNKYVRKHSKSENFKKKIRLISVGRLEYQKDYTTLIKAINILKNNFNIKLTIVGSGSQKNLLNNIINNLKLKDIVSIKQYSNNIYGDLNNSDILICTSLWEGTPNVLAEALAVKIPIVTTDFESAKELLSDSSNYKIAKRGDYVDISEKISELLKYVNIKNENLFWKKFKTNNFYKYEDLIKEL